MKLHTLSLFVRSLVEPLAHSGAASDSAESLRRASDLLSSFGDMSLGQFGDLLTQAKEYQASKQHAFPAYLQPVIASYESVRALKARTAQPEVNREELVRDLQAVPLDDLDASDLVRLAAEQGWEVKKKGKPEAINAIWRGITGAEKPKKAGSGAKRPPNAKVTVDLNEYAQKINDLKYRANSFEVSREELEKELNALNLDKLKVGELRLLAKQLARDVSGRTKAPEAIDAIKRVVLEVKEMLVGSAG